MKYFKCDCCRKTIGNDDPFYRFEVTPVSFGESEKGGSQSHHKDEIQFPEQMELCVQCAQTFKRFLKEA